MYSRSQRGGRITPPPGYVGSAFSGDIGVKYHEPENEEIIPPIAEEICDRAEVIPDRTEEKKPGEQNALSELMHSLRGRIATEELIILLVMLLTASEGVRVETVILALVLLVRQ